MADLRDDRGNPIQLTDEFGKPVQLTDEYGNPMHIKGVATTHHTATVAQMLHPEPHQQQQEQLHRSSSSSSSSEDDGEGGRRKKKGMKEKIIKKRLGKDKDIEAAPGTTTQQSKTSSTVPAGHEKKGMLDKIKEKLPGHHHHTPH